MKRKFDNFYTCVLFFLNIFYFYIYIFIFILTCSLGCLYIHHGLDNYNLCLVDDQGNTTQWYQTSIPQQNNHPASSQSIINPVSHPHPESARNPTKSSHSFSNHPFSHPESYSWSTNQVIQLSIHSIIRSYPVLNPVI